MLSVFIRGEILGFLYKAIRGKVFGDALDDHGFLIFPKDLSQRI